ncbi:response regulator [Ohtaekwangia kribbensis]|uniref:histidine kinase n=1 Tax=Ohtaekwangia kribbensis TaxID=688913 RepID=A0ABW3K029_9BACT
MTSLFAATSTMFMLSFGWMEILVITALLCVLLIVLSIKINRLKHDKLELKRMLNEKSELLLYSGKREQKALEDKAEVEKKKKNLLSRINHEIRTPMNGVMGMVTLLSETQLTNEQKDFNDTIRNCSESLLTVINDILLSDVLSYAKVESNAAELEQNDFDLRNAIEEVFDIFAGQAAQKDIELIYQVDHRIPSQIIGDNTRLRQVLTNLIENSVKFTKQGEIFVEVWVRNEEPNGVMDLGFEVRDSGVGIAEDELRFLSNTITQSGAQQSGIGLFLSNRLVGVMGGSFSIESWVNEGTVVKFNVPVNTGSHTLRSNPDMVGVEGKRVLIVEDNTTLRNVLKEEISYWKLIPVIADSGAQALELLSHGAGIDLVLAEMQMPEMNGMELSLAIRKKHPQLPIILMSTIGDESSKKYPELFSSVVTKPIRHSILSQHMLSALLNRGDVSAVNAAPAKAKLTTDFSKKYPLRILIAEDNRMNQKLAMRILGKLGYDPDIAENGKEVLEEVSKRNYDLILMDVQMPEMDGLEATRMIRVCLESQPVIIAMTANAMQGDREECLKNGMDDYISKPVNLEELVIILEKWAVQVKVRQ